MPRPELIWKAWARFFDLYRSVFRLAETNFCRRRLADFFYGDVAELDAAMFVLESDWPALG
jgi:hypothetical protein